jgi:hypothetical protein
MEFKRWPLSPKSSSMVVVVGRIQRVMEAKKKVEKQKVEAPRNAD